MTRTFEEILSDPDERALFMPFAQATATIDDRRRYQEWLLAKGDPRGELLALAHRLTADEPLADAAAVRARVQELAEQADGRWWMCLRPRSWLLNCARGPREQPAVRFLYECPRQWEDLDTTSAQGVRHCSDCQELVYECRTIEDAEAQALAGRCIAVREALCAEVTTRYPNRLMVGRPHPAQTWSNKLFARR